MYYKVMHDVSLGTTTLRERIELETTFRMSAKEVRNQLRGKQKETVELACKMVVNKMA